VLWTWACACSTPIGGLATRYISSVVSIRSGGAFVEGKLSWYRPHGRCHWIVFFSYIIGLLNYPSLRWEIVSGDLHTIAVAYDANGDPEMVMDILLFDHMTGEDSIRHAEKKVEWFPETNMAEGNELFGNGLRQLFPLKA
jgi:hypothetical protein